MAAEQNGLACLPFALRNPGLALQEHLSFGLAVTSWGQHVCEASSLLEGDTPFIMVMLGHPAPARSILAAAGRVITNKFSFVWVHFYASLLVRVEGCCCSGNIDNQEEPPANSMDICMHAFL